VSEIVAVASTALRGFQIHRPANRFQGAFEALFALRFPAMNIRAELEILK
jgi:hypothetical protein